MNRLPKEPYPFRHLEGCFVAGGAILSAITKTEPSDYDIYPKSKKAAIDMLYYLIDDEGCFVVNISDRAVTLKSNSIMNLKDERVIVQVMMFDTFPTAQGIFDFFDFTVCMAAFDCDSKEYVFHPDFWADVASKTLRFNPGTKYPLNSMMRIGKYRNKGYTLSTSEMIRMSLTLMQSRLPTSWEEMESLIGGTYGKQVKLHTQDLEFSVENAIQFFDDLNVDLLFSDAADHSSLKAEDLEVIFSDDPIQVLDVTDPNDFVSSKIIVDENGHISKKSHSDIDLITSLCKNVVSVTEDTVLYGYKTFKEMPDGTLENIAYHRKKLSYKIGEWTEEKVSPHIFVHMDRLGSYTTNAYLVEFRASDIVATSGVNDLTVKRVRVVKKV
jgi:hypothetical protein